MIEILFRAVLLIIAGGILVGTPYLIYRLTKPEPGEPAGPIEREKKLRNYLTSEFKIPKRIEDGDMVKPYPVPNSKKVNFYETNTYGGEGFLHKEINSTLWSIIEKNRDKSVSIVRTEANRGFIKVVYS